MHVCTAMICKGKGGLGQTQGRASGVKKDQESKNWDCGIGNHMVFWVRLFVVILPKSRIYPSSLPFSLILSSFSLFHVLGLSQYRDSSWSSPGPVLAAYQVEFSRWSRCEGFWSLLQCTSIVFTTWYLRVVWYKDLSKLDMTYLMG